MATLLIVDDDAHQRLLYRETFEAEGHTVREARSANEALAEVRRGDLDAVVLDINMPGLDGLDTLAAIHNLQRGLPIVLNTAYAEYRDQYVSWIADAYVVKSSDLSELRAAVHAVRAAHGPDGSP
jgi:CheY-like chemotaxis protein